jgi:hypothetical protein
MGSGPSSAVATGGPCIPGALPDPPPAPRPPPPAPAPAPELVLALAEAAPAPPPAPLDPNLGIGQHSRLHLCRPQDRNAPHAFGHRGPPEPVTSERGADDEPALAPWVPCQPTQGTPPRPINPRKLGSCASRLQTPCRCLPYLAVFRARSRIRSVNSDTGPCLHHRAAPARNKGQREKATGTSGKRQCEAPPGAKKKQRPSKV